MTPDRPTIILTGGAGYIGSHTAIELLQEGYEVVSIDNFGNSDAQRIALVKQITSKTYKNYPVDLCDLDAARKVFAKYRHALGVIHFAAYMSVEESVKAPWKYYHNNLNSLLNTWKLCEEYDIHHFVYSSSCSVYGNPQKLPVTEATPLQPATSPYAQTKLMGEQIIAEVSKQSPIKCISLRYFNPVGAHLSGLNGEYPQNKPYNLLPVVVEVAAGIRQKFTIMGTDYPTRDGTCVRDYLHVSDLAQAHLQALRWSVAEQLPGQCEVFNVGSGTGVSVMEIVRAFEEANQLKINYECAPRRIGDVVEIYADTRKVERLLGWKPQISLHDMMRSAWKWQQYLMQHQQQAEV